jgi:hypothetical protein
MLGFYKGNGWDNYKMQLPPGVTVESLATDPPAVPKNTLQELPVTTQMSKAPATGQSGNRGVPPKPQGNKPAPATDAVPNSGANINSSWNAADRIAYHRTGRGGMYKLVGKGKKTDEMKKLSSEEYSKKEDLTTQAPPGNISSARDRDVIEQRSKDYENYYKAGAEAHGQMAAQSSTDASVAGIGTSKTAMFVVVAIVLVGIGFYVYSKK